VQGRGRGVRGGIVRVCVGGYINKSILTILGFLGLKGK